jgi:hypothetical protein
MPNELTVADREVVIFVHIPKTAGTTLNRIIEWQYNPLSIFTVDPYRIRATVQHFKRLSEQRRRKFRMVRGHLRYGIHEFVPGPVSYVTMLREPAARLLSSYHFILRRPLHPLHRRLKRDRLGVEDLIRLTPNKQNLQCQFIAGINEGGICDERTLEIAKENLTRSFRVVGLCERFQESLLLMMTSFGWKVSFYENRKVAKVRPSADPRVVDMIHEHNRHDVALYDFAKKLFEEQLRKKQDAITEALSVLDAAANASPLKKFGYSSAGAGRFLLSKIASAI